MNNTDLELGVSIEKEHGGDEALAQKLAMDHLKEDPHYYKKLMAAGLGHDDETAQNIAAVGRAHAGQVGAEGGVNVVTKGPASVSPQQVNTQAPMSYAERPALKSSNIGQGAPALKSSQLSNKVPDSNSVVAGKTLPKVPEPSVENGETIVNKTTGAKMPNQVKIGNTQPIQGSEVGPEVVKVAVVGSDPLDYFASKIGQICEGGSRLKKAKATQD